MTARQYGPYRVEDVIGRGGTGVVYRAVHVQTGRAAAVKTVRLATETTLEAIRRELETLRELDHPGVVKILDHGVTDNVPWYAMELLRGRTLADELRSWFPAAGPAYSLPRVVELFRRICEPLAYVHGEGVIHRDLSPGNIFLTDDDSPVLFDFGLASQLERGTAHYLAPEQARGDAVDARADIYALGCMLYEALTGRPPFVGAKPIDVVMQHLEALPVSPAVHVPALPKPLEELVIQMLAKRPRSRVSFVDDVAIRLGAPRATKMRPYTYRPELAGRDAIIDAFDRSLAGIKSGGYAVLAGESGAGKTRLATELAVRARALGIRTIIGECDVHGPPLHPLRPLLRAIADRCREDGVARRMLGPLGGLLASYEPSLTGLAPPIADRIDPTVARFRVLSVLRDSIEELVIDQPLLLVIDDLQWADELTLALLQSFKTARRNLFVLATLRTEELTPAIAKLLAELPVARHELARLDRAAVDSIVRDMLALDEDPDGLAGQIAMRSEGNPLFAAEFVRSAVEDGELRRDETGRWRLAQLHTPETVRATVARRLHALSPPALHVARAASVLGRSCDANVLAATAGLTAEAARATMPELFSHHVLEEAGGNALRFSHDTLREEAYAELGADAVALHRAAAQSLADRASGELRLVELAHHWERAGELQHAADDLERAANHALATAAFGEAKELWQRLLGLRVVVGKSRRAAWQRALGETWYALGDLAQSAHHLTTSLELLEEPPLANKRAIAAGLGRQLIHRTLGRGSEDPALVTAALAAARMTTYYFFNDDTLGFLGSALRAINLAERAGTQVAVAEIYGQLGYIAGVAKLDRVARAYYERGIAVAAESHDPVGEARVYFTQAALQVGRGSWAEAKLLAERGQAIAVAMRNPQDQEVAHTILGHCEFATGNYLASQRAARALYESAHARANAQHEAWGIYTDARASLYLGEPLAAIAGFDRAMAILATIRDRASEILCGGMLASALARAGRLRDARVAADRTTRLIGKTTPPVFTISEGFIGAADAYLGLWQRGDDSAAGPATIAVANVARLARTFRCAAPAAAELAGRVRALRGERRAARRAFGQALATAEQLAMPYDQARALRGLGELGDHAAAARASKLFQQLGCIVGGDEPSARPRPLGL